MRESLSRARAMATRCRSPPESLRPRSDDGVVPFRQCGDEIVDVGRPAGRHQLNRSLAAPRLQALQGSFGFLGAPGFA